MILTSDDQSTLTTASTFFHSLFRQSLGQTVSAIKFPSGVSATSPSEQGKTIDQRVRQKTAGDEAKIKQCEKWRDEVMEKSVRVRTLLSGLASNGCAFRKEHFSCVTCDETLAGGFGPTAGVHLCSNIFNTSEQLEDTMAHELVHAYDYCTTKLNFEDIEHHACTEIRAAHLSGDCNFTKELRRGFGAFQGQFERCVRRRAALAVSYNPEHTLEKAKDVVNKLYPVCMADIAPFTEESIFAS
ncbi:peptidase M76 family-domain-containing protein [Phlyctochytrium arcticum]|nr:peptidase M76 family-domain-containing protein [Phlyctochytrium arcticum]